VASAWHPPLTGIGQSCIPIDRNQVDHSFVERLQPAIPGETTMHATASMLPETYSNTFPSPSAHDASVIGRDVENAEAPEGSAVKGLIVALGLEAAAVLLCCGIWQASHLIR
jgi:hypothetical protein